MYTVQYLLITFLCYHSFISTAYRQYCPFKLVNDFAAFVTDSLAESENFSMVHKKFTTFLGILLVRIILCRIFPVQFLSRFWFRTLQGWELDHRFFERIVRFLWSKERIALESLPSFFTKEWPYANRSHQSLKKSDWAKSDGSDLLFWHKKGE